MQRQWRCNFFCNCLNLLDPSRFAFRMTIRYVILSRFAFQLSSRTCCASATPFGSAMPKCKHFVAALASYVFPGSSFARCHPGGRRPIGSSAVLCYFSSRSFFAAATRFLRLAVVSVSPRVLRPQSGFTHTFCCGTFAMILCKASTISCSDGTRGEWMS